PRPPVRRTTATTIGHQASTHRSTPALSIVGLTSEHPEDQQFVRRQRGSGLLSPSQVVGRQGRGVPSLVPAVAPTSEQRKPSRIGGPPGFGAVDGGAVVTGGGT